ncbi:unnamed protein product [Citrullus colocynthis]|uniref:Trichome birefringence-like C-terminal domain-containing protein n=1 Tax=Citrullus colocynthis TaxID=252529 RepID=A0ABP0YVU3_9ROSI
MDMLIFNTAHWWTHTGTSQMWDYIQDENRVMKDMDGYVAYYKGLITWAKWVNLNVDPLKTIVLFLTISPTHCIGRDWRQPTKSCFGTHISLPGNFVNRFTQLCLFLFFNA